MSGSRSSRVLGRGQELAILYDLTGHVRDRGRALIVRCGAGTGKSALLHAAGA